MSDKSLNHRVEVTDKIIEHVYAKLRKEMEYSIEKHGRMSCLTNHESLGFLMEEVHEYIDEVRANNDDHAYEELIDIAASAIFSAASIIANEQEVAKIQKE